MLAPVTIPMEMEVEPLYPTGPTSGKGLIRAFRMYSQRIWSRVGNGNLNTHFVDPTT